MSPENSARSQRALFALRSYFWAKGERLADEDLDAGITDLLADLRHLCDARGLSFEHLDGWALEHHAAELAEGGAS